MKIARWLGPAALAVAAAGFVWSCKPKASVPESFLSLAPRESFLYLHARDLKALRDKTKAFDFIAVARRLRLASRLEGLLEKKIEAEGPIPEGPRKAGQEIRKIIRKAKLWEVIGNEVAFFAFPTEKTIKPALVAVCRLPAGAGKEYLGYFEEAVNVLIEGRKAEVSRSQYLEESLNSLVLTRNDISLAPTWAVVGDVFILSSRPEGAREVVARLKGRGERASLADSPSFRKAMQGLDPAARAVWYGRADGLLDWALRVYKFQKRRLGGGIESSGLAGGLESAEAEQARYYLRLFTRAARTVEAVGGCGDLDGAGWGETSRIYLDPKEGSGALREMLQAPPREHKVLSLFPAKSVSASAGFFSPEKLYRLVAGYIVKNPVHGKAAARRWQEAQREAGLDVTDDLLSALGDEYGFALVTFAQNMFSPGSFVLAWKAKGAAEAEKAIARLTGAVRAKTTSEGVSYLNITEEEYDGVGMRVLYLPFPLAGLNPTLGVVDGYLVLASGKDTFQSVVEIAKKREKSIREDGDFRRLAVRTAEKGTSISFSRVADQVDNLASSLRSFSALLALGALGEKPQTPEEEKERAELNETMSLLNDAARVVEALKAYRVNASSCAYTGGCLEMKNYTEIEMKEGK